jgi:hypothetical protein
LEPEGTGTKVTECFHVHWLPPMARFFEDVVIVNRDRAREDAMRATLSRIKGVAEAASLRPSDDAGQERQLSEGLWWRR